MMFNLPCFILLGFVVILSHSAPSDMEKSLEAEVSNSTTVSPLNSNLTGLEQDLMELFGDNEKVSNRIVGGYVIPNDNQYPWMAGVWYNGKLFCSGSIISAFKVLTSLSCVRQYPGAKLYVSVGSVFSSTLRSFQYPVMTVSTPPYVLSNGTPNPNFAFLHVQMALPIYLPSVSPVCLSLTSAADLSVNSGIIALGWGRTSGSSSTPSSTLKKAFLKMNADSTCSSFYGSRFNSAHSFCARWNNGAICGEDEGGPAVVVRNNKYFQIGVNSISSGSCSSSSPMAFASTTTSTFISYASPFQTC